MGHLNLLFSDAGNGQVLEHFMKHGKTKKEEEEEVALVNALAERRLREVGNDFMSKWLWCDC